MKKNVVYYGSKELINVSEVKYPKDAIISALNEDGTRGVAVNVVVTPTNIDPADLKFNLVNSEGATIFEEAVVSTPKGALQRAAMDGVYTLHFALKEGVTVADIKKGSIISQDDALAVVCGKAATAFEYKAGLENAADITQGKTTDNYKAKDNTYVKLGETYSLFGKGYAADPSANPNAAAQAFLTKLEGVSDIALSLDENLKSLYGITIDGTNFTISNEAAYGKEIIRLRARRPIRLPEQQLGRSLGAFSAATFLAWASADSMPIFQPVSLAASRAFCLPCRWPGIAGHRG